MKHQLVTKICEQCGQEMVCHPRARFCPTCSYSRKLASIKESAKKRRIDYSQRADMTVSRDVRLALHTVTNDNLTDWFNHHRHDPNNRPEWCSPVRWRIFLRFIKNVRYYSHDGELHPGQARGIATVKFSPLRRHY